MENGNVAVTIIVIFTATIIMFIFPLMTMADKQDDVTQLAVQRAITETVNQVRTTGYFSQEMYDNLILALGATGNAYKVEMVVQKLDANPAAKTVGETVAIGDNVYYVMYTQQVEEALAAGGLRLTEGDIVSITAENATTTIAGQLRNSIYRVTGKGNGNIAGKETGIVTQTTTK